VKNQDASSLVETEMADRQTRDHAWQYVQQNWPRVQAQLTTWTGGSLVASTGSFCSGTQENQVTDFFHGHNVPAAEHALNKARDSITDCVQFRAAQKKNLERWSQQEPAAAPWNTAERLGR